MFLVSPSRNLSVPNKEIELKFLSHSYGSVGWFA